MKAGKIAAAVVAAFIGLAALGLIVGGTALAWAFGTQRDADGFLTSPDYRLESPGYAVVSGDIDLASRPGDWWPTDLADFRLNVTSGDAGAVFVGIGPSDDVNAYLGQVARDEVTSLGTSATDVTLESRAGGAPVGKAADQGFWVVSSQGSDTQSVTWDVEAGEWSIVVMNADGTSGVTVTAEAGFRIGLLLAVAIGLIVAGVFLGGLAAVLLVWAVLPERALAEPAEAGVLKEGAYPVVLEGHLDPNLTRWMWLVKWLLAIPHLVVLAFLWAAFAVLTIVAFFAILFTGRYPRSIFDFNVGVMRWTWRVDYYAFSAIGTDAYPPFTLAETDYPARLAVAYPEQLSRGLVLVKWWLLAIPHYLIVGLFTSGLVWWATDFGGDSFLQVGGGLIGILVLIAGVALLFSGRYPQGLFDLVMGLNRWVFRVMAYATLMRDEYPPFRLDPGGSDPGVARDYAPAGSPASDAAAPGRMLTDA